MNLAQFFLATRPKTLIAVIFPLLMVISLGKSLSLSFNQQLIFVCFLCGIFIQISVNLFNDYYDDLRGADRNRVGPDRLTQNLQNKNLMRNLGVIFLGLAFLVSIPLYQISFYYLLLGLSACFFSYAYTGGPYPLAYHGLGELFVLIYFGFVLVLGSAFAIFETLHPDYFFLSVIIGLLNTQILMANNLRDFESDKKVGKNTLAVYLGLSGYKILLSLLSVIIIIFTHRLFQTQNFWLFVINMATGGYIYLLWRARKRSQRKKFFAINLLFYILYFACFCANFL